MARWSSRETRKLEELFTLGYTDLEIARHFAGRSAWSIGKRRRRLGLRTYGRPAEESDAEIVVPRREAIYVSHELLKRLVLNHRDRTPADLRDRIVAASRQPSSGAGRGIVGADADIGSRSAVSIGPGAADIGRCLNACPPDVESGPERSGCPDAACDGENCGLIRRILTSVAEKHGIASARLLGRDATRPVVLARQELYWRLRQETDYSYPEIGRLVGGRDHSSILHGVRRHTERSGLSAVGEAGEPEFSLAAGRV